MATIIHSDEALLAVGFIFTVHFFNTHLRPEKFPMDIVVFTGRMPIEEFKRDKPAEYEALVAAGTLEEHLEEPYQPVVIKAVRFFGWTALTLGFLIVMSGSSTQCCSRTDRCRLLRVPLRTPDHCPRSLGSLISLGLDC